jgi:ABC-type dipeptide/oligopeptide/nickel transport system permease subunit
LLPPVVTQESVMVRGRMISASRELELYWRDIAQNWLPTLLVTLKLVGVALVIGMAVGVVAGWLMSRLAPGWVRKPMWGLTAALGCLPDLLIAIALDVGLVLVGRAMDRQWVAADLAFYQHFLGPVMALSLLVVPYVARVTAAAIEEVSGQLFVRTAVAKGLHLKDVTLRHIGKPVLLRVWTLLPVVVSILISGAAVIEYMMEIHGLGRALVLHLGPGGSRVKDPYAGALLIVPLLVIFTVVSGLSEAGLRKLDPRVGGTGGQGVERPWAGQSDGGLRAWLRSLAGAPAAVWRWLAAVPGGVVAVVRSAPAAVAGAVRSAPGTVAEAVRSLPVALLRAVQALRDPVLLGGVLLVGALVAVAVLAPKLAPYAPSQVFKAYQDEAGKIWAPPFTPMPTHLLGTDMMGRDVFTRLIYGARYALLFAAMAVPARFMLAVLLGLPAAWRGGFWSRLIDWLSVIFTAVPQLVVPLVLVQMANNLYVGNPSASLAWGVVCIALPGVPRLAASVRQQAETVLAQPFLEGAVASGAGSGRILWRHVLPHMLPQLVTMLVAEVPQVATMTATLAYFKVAPGGWLYDDDLPGMPVLPEWGSMMEQPLMLILARRWWMLAPFGALFVAVLAFTLLGEGLRRRWQQKGEWGWGSKAA